MRTLPIPRIYECLAKDELRPAMNYALVTKADVVASDAHVLIIHKTTDLFPEDFIKQIPEEGFMFTRAILIDMAKPSAELVNYVPELNLIKVTHTPKGSWSYNTYFDVHLNGSDRTGKYPAYMNVVPDWNDLEPLDQICLRPSYLNRLMKAMETPSGLGNMRLRFKGGEIGKPIMCEPLDPTYQCKGIIMPVMANNPSA